MSNLEIEAYIPSRLVVKIMSQIYLEALLFEAELGAKSVHMDIYLELKKINPKAAELIEKQINESFATIHQRSVESLKVRMARNGQT